MIPKDHIADGDAACRKCGGFGFYQKWDGGIKHVRCSCVVTQMTDRKNSDLSQLLAESVMHQESETRWAAQYKAERDILAKKLEWQPIETAPTDGTRFLVYDDFEPCMEWAWINGDSELVRCSSYNPFWQKPSHWLIIDPPAL